LDGVERIMVLGIFAVIVSILAVAAWSVTQDDLASAGATDGGAPAVVVSPAGRSESAPPLGNRADQKALLAQFEQRKAERQATANRVLERPRPKQVPISGRGGIDSLKMPSQYVKSTVSASPVSGKTPVDRLAQGAHDGRRAGSAGALSPRIDSLSGKPLVLKANAPKGESKGRNKPGTRPVVIKDGDTLWAIVSRGVAGDASLKAKLAATLSLNANLSANSIRIGQRIVLPVRVDVGSAPVRPAANGPTKSLNTPSLGNGASRLYTVMEGDSLSTIAKQVLGKASRYQEIFELNADRLSSASEIRVGMTLRLPEK